MRAEGTENIVRTVVSLWNMKADVCYVKIAVIPNAVEKFANKKWAVAQTGDHRQCRQLNIPYSGYDSYIPKLVFLVHRLINLSNIHLGRINATSVLRVMLKIPSMVFLPKSLFDFAVTL